MIDRYIMVKYFCHILKNRLIIDCYLNIFHIVIWKGILKKYPTKKVHLFPLRKDGQRCEIEGSRMFYRIVSM